jgi:predicted dehydrogenase
MTTPTGEPGPDVVRVALCGYGFAGRGFHAPLIQATPGLELVAVASTRPDAVHADLPDVAVHGEPVAAMREADLVVLAGPHHTHAGLALAALDLGRHVVVDKPMALRLDEARAMAARAREVGRLLAVFHNRRWDNDFLALTALARDGVIGNLVHLASHFDRFRPQVRDRWREQPGPAAGLWFDLGPHLVDQALQLFGVPTGVWASLAAQRPGAATDDWAHVVLEFGRARAVLHASLLAAAPAPRFVAHGTRGSWVKYGLDVQESQLMAGQRPGDPDWGRDPRPALVYDGMVGDGTEVALPCGAWEQFYLNVRDAVDGHAALIVAVEQAVAVTAVMDAAFESARTGRAVRPDLSEAERAAVVPVAAPSAGTDGGAPLPRTR